MLFQELCEIIDNNIKLKDDVKSADIESCNNVINNVLGDIFYKVHSDLPENLKDKKNCKLSTINMGSGLYNILKNTFELEDMYSIFNILVLEDLTIANDRINYNYSWTAFEMGSM